MLKKCPVKHSVPTIVITPQILRSDDLTPSWRTLDTDGHETVPIMERSTEVPDLFGEDG